MSKVTEIGSGRSVGTPDEESWERDRLSPLRSGVQRSCRGFFCRLLVLLEDLVGEAGALSVSRATVERSEGER